MAVLTREQFMERVSKLITGDTDEDIRNIEDFTDTYNDMETRIAGAGDNWKQKYEDNDREWRERYKQRFFTPEPDTKNPDVSANFDKSNEDTTQVDNAEDTYSYNDLFNWET